MRKMNAEGSLNYLIMCDFLIVRLYKFTRGGLGTTMFELNVFLAFNIQKKVAFAQYFTKLY